MLSRFNKLSTTLKWICSTTIGAFILFVLSFVFSAFFQTAIGTFTTPIVNALGNWLSPIKDYILVPWVIIALLLFLIIFLLYKLAHQEQKKHLLEQQFKSADSLFALQLESLRALFTLEDGLIRLLPALVSAKAAEKEDAMRQLIAKLQTNAKNTLPHVHRAALFLPDAKREELSIFRLQGVASTGTTCYIGPPRPDRKRGVAGEAFVKQELIIARKTGERNQDGDWNFDRDSYINFSGSGVLPPFNAIACMPLFDKKGSSETLGVICFDSLEKNAFDDPIIQEHLKLIGRCFTSALLVYQETIRDQTVL